VHERGPWTSLGSSRRSGRSGTSPAIPSRGGLGFRAVACAGACEDHGAGEMEEDTGAEPRRRGGSIEPKRGTRGACVRAGENERRG
jgi:hypothetical protein